MVEMYFLLVKIVHFFIAAKSFFYLGREFFVGLTKATNMAGAKAVASTFQEYPVTLLKVCIFFFSFTFCILYMFIFLISH